MAESHFEVAAFVISRTAVQAHDQHQSEKHRYSTFCYVWPICTKNKSAILIVKEIFCIIHNKRKTMFLFVWNIDEILYRTTKSTPCKFYYEKERIHCDG